MPTLARAVVQRWKDRTGITEIGFRHTDRCSITREATFVFLDPAHGTSVSIIANSDGSGPFMPGKLALLAPGSICIEQGEFEAKPYLCIAHNPSPVAVAEPVFKWPAKIAAAHFFAETPAEIHRFQLDTLHAWLTTRDVRFDDMKWDGRELRVCYRQQVIDRFQLADLVAQGALPDPNNFNHAGVPYELLLPSSRGSHPVRHDVPGAPFKIGEEITVTLAPDQDDGTLTPEEVSFWNGRKAVVTYFEYSCGCGQSFPADPMIGVEADGHKAEFWKAELSEASNIAALPPAVPAKPAARRRN